MTTKELKKLKIGVLFGGISSEREISLVSGKAVLNGLISGDYNAVPIDVDRNIHKKLEVEKIDVAFIALHGEFGEDGTIQGVLDFMEIPYTGSSLLASAMTMDKAVSKEIFEYHQIPTPSFEVVTKRGLQKSKVTWHMQPPVVIKPANGGSTIGISIARTEKEIASGIQEAFKWDEKVLIERFVEGDLVTVSILDGTPLPVIEIVPKTGFYDYHAKYTTGETTYHLPARISIEKQQECQRLALDAHNALKCSGATRADFIINSDGIPYILEVNTIPGMTKTSLLPMAAAGEGISFPELVEQMLKSAVFGENLQTSKEPHAFERRKAKPDRRASNQERRAQRLVKKIRAESKIIEVNKKRIDERRKIEEDRRQEAEKI